MFVGTTLGSNSTPIPNHNHESSHEHQLDSPFPAVLPQSHPCWAAKAQYDLSQAEAQLRCLQERHATETDSVKRGVERAILGARSEERRLLERVEQDHRDAQQHLEQVKRDNMAAVRVSQSLLDQRLHKLAQLQQQITEAGQQSDLCESGPDQNLLKEIAEFLKPWEVSLSLKKVNFKPSSQPNAIAFGDIRVQEQSLSLCVGSSGPQGQLCALHSLEMQCEDTNHQGAGGQRNAFGQRWISPTGRVVRKINLSAHSNQESEEQKISSTKISHWLPKCERTEWEAQHDDEMESASCVSQGEEATKKLKNMATGGKEQMNKTNGDAKNDSPRSPRMLFTGASGRKPSPSSEQRWKHPKLNFSLDTQEGPKKKVSHDSSKRSLKCWSNMMGSPTMILREPMTSQSCLDLTSSSQRHCCLSQSSDEHSLGTHSDSGRAPSPTDSLDSSYTFIISHSNDYNVNKGFSNYKCHRSKSAVDLTRKTEPLIRGTNEHAGMWRLTCGHFNSLSNSTSMSPAFGRGHRVTDMGQSLPNPTCRSHSILQQPQKITLPGSKQSMAFSMSVIDDSSQELKRDRGEMVEPTLVELEEDGNQALTVLDPREVLLIRQFGKQGSGRADLTLPSGIHATPQGLLFIVDCGNARVQVTDPQGNVLQQVTSLNPDGSGRRCRNYFDVAVNAKGLIALSCAAERALLVFSRHGRLLQTFGGTGFGSAKDDLEAPRGVTVTRLDEFLVADIRKGILIALKLDPKTGSCLERTVVTGFHRPYLVAGCLSSGIVAVSERGNETGSVPCIKVLEPGWNTLRVLGVCAGMGPILSCPWGICIDSDGNVLVTDWGEQHRVLLYSPQGVGWPIVTQGLSCPRGLTLLPKGHLVVSDSMHHCIKIYQYKAIQN